MSDPTVAEVHTPRLFDWQKRIEGEARRFNVLAKGRRTGGTQFAIDRAIDSISRGGSVGWFSATYKLLAEAERKILGYLDCVCSKRNVSEHRYEFLGGGVLELWSLEGDISARGRKYNRAVIDEAAFVDDLRDKWEQQIRPALADHQGDAWFVSSPNGMNYFKTLFDRAHDPAFPDWASWQLATAENPRMAAAEIDSMRASMEESNYRQECLAQFVIRKGACFPMFSRDRHVREIEVDHDLRIHIGYDFGFRTTAAVLFQLPSNGQVHIIGESEFTETTTWDALHRMAQLPYGNGKAFAATIGTIGCDPAGSGRNLQTGMSDLELVRRAFPAASVRYSTRDEHRSPEWRAARMRDLLLAADGTVRLYVDRRCTRTIRMLENSVYPEHREGHEQKQEPVKDGVVDHIRDALGYGLVNSGVFGHVTVRGVMLEGL